MKPGHLVLPTLLFAALISALSGAAMAQEAKIITISDAGSVVDGKVSISDYQGPLPSQKSGNRAIPEMPGWPITVGKAGNFAPSRGVVFEDLDGDGTQEVIMSSTDKFIYAWDYAGNPMPGFPVNTIEMPQYAPAVGDLDGDGDMEIVQFTRGLTSGGRLYVIDHQGNNLPGFPVNINNNNVSSSPCIYDLDNDGDLEILVPERAYPIGYLHVFEYDATEWGGRWPVAMDHVPACSPGVADVDGDGDPEIAIYSYNSIYMLETDGNHMPGWPKQIANANFSYQSPAFADLDDDGDLEIVVGAHKTAAGCYVFHHDGSSYPGWPKMVGTWTYCPPTVTDLEQDGELEILDGRAGGFGGYSNCFWAWTASGVTKPGFPYAMSHGGGSEGPLTVADINNDGKMEIFADHNIMESGNGQGYLFGVDSNGNDLPDFPLRPQGFTYMNGATIGDVDGDGDYDLGVVSYDDFGAHVHLYDMTGTYHPSDISWESYHMKSEHGGWYRTEDRLHTQGTFALNSPVTLYVHGDPTERAFLFLSLGTNKLYHNVFGWFYLNLTPPAPFPIVWNAAIPTSGEIALNLKIPSDPAMVGMTLYFQGLTGPDPYHNDGTWTNMLGRTVQ